MSGPPQADCDGCHGTGQISQKFFDLCIRDGLRCGPVGSRCLCTVTMAEIDTALPALMDDILRHIDKSDP